MAQLDKIKLSGTTYDIVDSTALHSLDDNVTSGGTNAVKGSGIYNAITAATGALAETIAEQGYQTSGDVQNAISGKVDTTAFTAHTADTVAHTTQAEKNAWDAKLDANAVSGYADSVKYNSTSKYVEFYHGGTGGTKVFEYDASPFLIDGMVQNVEIKDVPLTEEATLTTTVTSYTFNSGATSEAIVKVTDGWWTDSQWKTTFLAFGGGSGSDCILAQVNGSIFCDNGTATNTGNTIHIQANDAFTNVYYQGITNLSYFESISAVYGSQTCLVISFNTDAGKQDINVPLTDIFDASNYYTTAQTDNKIAEATSGKADTTAVTESINAAVSGKADSSTVAGINDVLTAHTANTDVHVTTSDKSTWSGKQDALVNQVNIKSINGNSLLGSGNIDVQTLPTVSGTTLIFS